MRTMRPRGAGNRLLNTAAYFNEEAVGAAVKSCGIPCKELFITTKLWIQDTGYGETLRSFDASLKKLGLDYLDLYLIHQPFLGKYYGSWQAMEQLYEEGRVRTIGVSNFEPDRLADLCLNHAIALMVNQVEIHPFHQQEPAIRVMKGFDVQPQGWGPLAEGKHGIFTHPVLTKIGKKYGKTPAQVALRWNIQRSVVIIPKSTHIERMEQNMDIWDFSLSAEDMAEIAKLDIGHSEIVNHYDPAFVKMLHGLQVHA